jgi:hypothetical protein
MCSEHKRGPDPGTGLAVKGLWRFYQRGRIATSINLNRLRICKAVFCFFEVNMDLKNIDEAERTAVGLVTRLIPWLAPIPSAYLVGRAAIQYLEYPIGIGIIAAVIIEAMGLAATSTALDIYIYNQTRRKVDPPAPLFLAIVLVLAYLFIATCLTIIVEVIPNLAIYAPVIFPSLSLSGAIILALQSMLSNRQKAIAEEKAERKAERQAVKPVQRQTTNAQLDVLASNTLSMDEQMDSLTDKLHAGKMAKLDARLNALIEVFRKEPNLEIAEAARRIQVSRQTVYSYLSILEKAGRLKRGENGIEVLG